MALVRPRDTSDDYGYAVLQRLALRSHWQTVSNDKNVFGACECTTILSNGTWIALSYMSLSLSSHFPAPMRDLRFVHHGSMLEYHGSMLEYHGSMLEYHGSRIALSYVNA